MALHHAIPKFQLKRWTNSSGQLEIVDLEALEVSQEDPAMFLAFPDFNRYEQVDGSDDPWLEHEFFGRLDSDVANLLPQLERLAPPRSHLRHARNNGWHLTHLLSPKSMTRLAMYLGAQAVRHPAWREAVRQQTAETMRDFIEEKVARDLAAANDPMEIERLKAMQGLRYAVTEISGNRVPHLSAHLSFRLGQVLYEEYSWALIELPAPALILADDPLLVVNWRKEHLIGSYRQVAQARGRALSIYKSDRAISDDAVAAMRSNDLILFPLDPRRVLLLASFELIAVAGRHDASPLFANFVNSVSRLACKRWMCLPPAHLEAAQEAIYVAHPWKRRFDEARAS